MTARYDLLIDALPEHRDPLLALWAAHSSLGERAADKLAHAYLGNPMGPGTCILLHGGRPGHPIGALGLHQRRWVLGERRQDSAVLADVVVDPAHRTLGPALMLMRAAVALALQRQGWVCGMPNAASLAVLRRAGVQELLRLQRRGKLLRSRFWLERHGWEGLPTALTRPLDGALAAVDQLLGRHAGWRWRDTGFDDAALGSIWERRPRQLCLGDRSPEVLAWRFGATSTRSAWRLSVAERAQGEAMGYVVWRDQAALAEIGDVSCTDPQRDLVGLLLGFAEHCRQGSATVAALSLEIGAPAALTQPLARAGFLVTGEGQPVVGAAREGLAPWPVDRLYMTTFDRDPEV